MKKALAKRTSARQPAPAPERRSKSGPFLLPERRNGLSRAQTVDAPLTGGRFTQLCHDTLRRSLGVRDVILTRSRSHAIETAVLLLDIQPGDEVIVPSLSSISIVNAIVLRGARPVFGDIRRDTLNLDESQLATLITRRTRAIVPVHYAGVGCAMEAIQKLAAHHGIAVIEDNAHGLYGSHRGKPLGSFGSLGVLSFDDARTFPSGDGGALLINDPAIAAEAENLRVRGTGGAAPSEDFAVLLYSRLEARDRIRKQQRAVWQFYIEHLRDWAVANGVGLPCIPDDCVPAYHLFYVLLPCTADRARLIAHLKAAGITATSDYFPLHLSVMGRRFGGEAGDCPVTEDISDRMLGLPFYDDLSPAEQSRIVKRIRCFK